MALIIPCPWCGPRDETEFAYGGEAHIARPKDPDALSDAEWGDYLFMRKNPKGRHLEQWGHAFGCRRWFNVERDTVTYAIRGSYKPGEQPPSALGEGLGQEQPPSPLGEGLGREQPPSPLGEGRGEGGRGPE